MNEAIIRNWNAVVPKNGHVFILGDMFWKGGDMEKNQKVMSRLNGIKYLVSGNHDNYARDEYLRLGFEEAWDYLELQVEKKLVVCNHYPLLEWNGFYRGSWHLHGHVHGRGSHFSFRVIDMGVDAANFMPLCWRQICRELDGGWNLDQEAMTARGDILRHCPYTFKD